MAVRVAVIGGGVNGVGSALAILQTLPHVAVTMVTSQVTPHTTGDGAAGLWGPHRVTADPHKIAAWGQATHDLFHRLWLQGDCPGIGLLSGLEPADEAPYNAVPFFHGKAPTVPRSRSPELPEFQLPENRQLETAPPADDIQQSQATRPSQAAPQSQVAPQLQAAPQSQVAPQLHVAPQSQAVSQSETKPQSQALPQSEAMSQSKAMPQSQMAPQSPADSNEMVAQVTFYAEPSKFLPFLLSRFRALGGRVIISTVTSLDQLAEYDVIVNCSGLGARSLIGDDALCPVRGQVVRVRAPFVKTFIARGGFYIIPNDDVVILGGTAQAGDWRTEPDPADTDRIVDGCCRLVPALRTAPVETVWAGLRPFRAAGVRLEQERRLVAGTWRPLVHNYGHGGAGVTLFWGCALEVAELVRRQVQALGASSKL